MFTLKTLVSAVVSCRHGADRRRGTRQLLLGTFLRPVVFHLQIVGSSPVLKQTQINYTRVLAQGSCLLCIWSHLVFILIPLSPPFASSCPSCIAVLFYLLLLLMSPRLYFLLMFFPSFYRFPSSSACVHFDLSKMLTFEDGECSEGQAESERRAR